MKVGRMEKYDWEGVDYDAIKGKKKYDFFLLIKESYSATWKLFYS